MSINSITGNTLLTSGLTMTAGTRVTAASKVQLMGPGVKRPSDVAVDDLHFLFSARDITSGAIEIYGIS